MQESLHTICNHKYLLEEITYCFKIDSFSVDSNTAKLIHKVIYFPANESHINKLYKTATYWWLSDGGYGGGPQIKKQNLLSYF